MKAIHKYKLAAKKGNKEAQRRISQSMGYKMSVWDMPHLIALMEKAGIMLEDTQGVLDYDYDAVTETIKI